MARATVRKSGCLPAADGQGDCRAPSGLRVRRRLRRGGGPRPARFRPPLPKETLRKGAVGNIGWGYANGINPELMGKEFRVGEEMRASGGV